VVLQRSISLLVSYRVKEDVMKSSVINHGCVSYIAIIESRGHSGFYTDLPVF